MKRTKKLTFFIVALLIFALAYTTFAGVYTYNGDIKKPIIKGLSDIRWGIDIRGGVETVFVPGDEVEESKITDAQIDTAKEVIEKRLIGANITDYELYQDYDEHQIIVRFPWKADDESFDAEAAIKEIGETPVLEFCRGTTQDDVVIGGKNIVEATPSINEQTGEPVVAFKLDEEGTEAFAKATEELAGTGTISIWLDGQMISNPSVQNAIPEGEGIITGFTEEQARTLSNQINSGALPFTLKTVENRTRIISPSEGESALNAMAIAGVIAFALVCLFMIFFYRMPGIVAAIALLGQVALSFAVVSGYVEAFDSFTLTIPGLAGMILSIGMGVDANVISIERIQEELKKGRTIDGAVNEGYKNSFSAIFDGNITVIIVAVVLMAAFGPTDGILAKLFSFVFSHFGSTLSGSIYSFGYTLLVGVAGNFVMGVTASKLMVKSLSRFEFFRKPFWFSIKAGGEE